MFRDVDIPTTGVVGIRVWETVTSPQRAARAARGVSHRCVTRIRRDTAAETCLRTPDAQWSVGHDTEVWIARPIKPRPHQDQRLEDLQPFTRVRGDGVVVRVECIHTEEEWEVSVQRAREAPVTLSVGAKWSNVDDVIVVHIPALADDETAHAVWSALHHATFPHRVYVAVYHQATPRDHPVRRRFEQYAMLSTEEVHEDMQGRAGVSPWYHVRGLREHWGHHVYVDTVPTSKVTGVCVARHRLEMLTLHRGVKREGWRALDPPVQHEVPEWWPQATWVTQIDCHNSFHTGWDVSLIYQAMEAGRVYTEGRDPRYPLPHTDARFPCVQAVALTTYPSSYRKFLAAHHMAMFTGFRPLDADWTVSREHTDVRGVGHPHHFLANSPTSRFFLWANIAHGHPEAAPNVWFPMYGARPYIHAPPFAGPDAHYPPSIGVGAGGAFAPAWALRESGYRAWKWMFFGEEQAWGARMWCTGVLCVTPAVMPMWTNYGRGETTQFSLQHISPAEKRDIRNGHTQALMRWWDAPGAATGNPMWSMDPHPVDGPHRIPRMLPLRHGHEHETEEKELWDWMRVWFAMLGYTLDTHEGDEWAWGQWWTPPAAHIRLPPKQRDWYRIRVDDVWVMSGVNMPRRAMYRANVWPEARAWLERMSRHPVASRARQMFYKLGGYTEMQKLLKEWAWTRPKPPRPGAPLPNPTLPDQAKPQWRRICLVKPGFYTSTEAKHREVERLIDDGITALAAEALHEGIGGGDDVEVPMSAKDLVKSKAHVKR